MVPCVSLCSLVFFSPSWRGSVLCDDLGMSFPRPSAMTLFGGLAWLSVPRCCLRRDGGGGGGEGERER